MSYRKTWAKTFDVNELKLTQYSPLGVNVAPCTEHPPYCIRAKSTSPLVNVGGYISIQNPLSIPNILPGVKKKILTITVEGMVKWSGYVTSSATLKVLVDDAEIMPKNEVINQADTFRLNTFPINANVDTGLLLDFSLLLGAHVVVYGWVDKHEQKISMTGESYVDTPPVTASVRITVSNKQIGGAINNAYVALMSGAVIEADGYTSAGEITLLNVNEGSYMLRVRAGGYYDLEQAVDVTAPSVWYNAALAPIPVPPSILPWWAIPVIVGVAGVGGVITLGSLRGRREREPVYVIK